MANFLTNDGQATLLDIAFRGGAPLATLDFGLTDAALSLTSVLADAVAGEPSGNGYARQTISQDGTGWPTDAASGLGWMLTSEDIVWTATPGNITPFNKVFLTDGVLLLAVWDVTADPIAPGTPFTFLAKAKVT
jgi:hypothetical protein